MVRKHCGKRRNCLLQAISPFATVFSKDLYCRHVKSSTVLFRYSPWCTPPTNNALQYYVNREKCKVNDIIFPSSCEARAINLDNKNMKIGIFTGGTRVRSKNIFTDISRYPTGKHELKS